MTVSISWDVSDARWRELLARCEQATFFHSPGWYRAQAAVSGYRLAPAAFRFEDGTEALLPLAVRPRFRGLLAYAEAGIECGYGGLVASAPLDEARLKAAWRLVRARYPDLHVVGNPHAALESAMAGGEAGLAATQLVTVCEPETQLRRMSPKRAARVRKSARVGFELTVIERPEVDAVARFYPLYAAHASYWSHRRWVRDEAYFRALLQHAGAELVLFLVHLNGEPAGFRLLAVQGTRAVGLHLATTPVHERLDVGPFMIMETLAWCYAHGIGVFDFLPSGPLAGVKAYKASYGAVEAPFLSVSTHGLRGRCLSFVWQRLSTGAPPEPAIAPTT